MAGIYLFSRVLSALAYLHFFFLEAFLTEHLEEGKFPAHYKQERRKKEDGGVGREGGKYH